MDAFSDLIREVRAHGSLFGSTTLTPPEPLRARETLLVRGPATFAFVDEVGTRAEPVACGEHCATPEQGGTRHRLGRHDPGDGARDATTLVVGAYPVRGGIGRPLLDALPVVLRVGGGADPVLDHLAAEVAVDAPGRQVVLDRLPDWMPVCALREWFDRPGGEPPAWWAAQRDPVVGDALRLLHAEPAARGRPPRSPTAADVARAVGHSDPFGFSAAFKRVRGVNPSEFRRTATTVPG
ncbi:cupin domain-containing protein [Saccharothrix sp. Mg75]|uniref:cupin domain-containing protein n=1 Tax=Saccharothrix sp. Mg75 TaxID=3445357 RepID=UPI003EEF6624